MRKNKTPILDIPSKPSPIKAIRKYCLSCGDGTSKDVELCSIRNCPLHPYRFGVMPATYIAQNSKKKAL